MRKIGILGLELNSGNKGCSALGYSFIHKLNIILGYGNFEIFAVLRNTDIPQIEEFSKIKWNVIKIESKKFGFYSKTKKIFNNCDIIFDFTEGDSFTDIYGIVRFVKLALIKEIALSAKKVYVLGPQTYGPFNGKIAKFWSKRIIKHSNYVYSRDRFSAEYVEKMCAVKVKVLTDVAMSLWTHKKSNTETSEDIIKIGINISGLLWNGGYSGKNQFDLLVDYQQYCREIIEKYSNIKKYQIYLIPHVISDENPTEDDLYVSKLVKKSYPNVIVMDRLIDPVDAKSFISTMNIFIGARMHATIAAVSTGVYTIPFSYSRKFQGLYDTIEYPYVIDGKKMSTETAIDLTEKYIQTFSNNEYQMERHTKIIEGLDTELTREFSEVLNR